MGLNLRFCINKTGKTCNVVDRNTGKTVGALNNREAFIYYGSEGEISCICFLDPNGNFKTVDVSSNAAYITNNKSCCDYPYGTTTIDGEKYYTFKMRSQKTVYYSDGVSKWGSVAAGMLVATKNTKVNPDSPHLKEISYVQRSSDKKWIAVGASGKDTIGYVDTGIRSASGYSSIPFYGSW